MATRQYFIQSLACEAPILPAALYVVSTPIGNLKDISLRALETLAGADLILCEDTRTSAKLLNAYGIKTPRRALHEHNESEMAQILVDEIKNGKSICLICDAGTPLISDPGFPLVRKASEQQIAIYAIPGASAILSGLAISGLPTDSFSFFGFLPAKNQARLTRLEALKDCTETLVFYESPKRIAATLSALEQIFGPDRYVVVARELTKKFETLYRGTAAQLALLFEKETVKGEIVLMVQGASPTEMDDPDQWRRALQELLKEMPLRGAVDKIAADFNLKRKAVYQAALEMRDG